ncbi:NAD-dependent epimerase/dehydratase family protein [Bradyrhizobium genosp. P]|uniref:NAD-dependent epimerase/dehydratase family protein n=1 Tax=Bradyrhizobium genosp. P TaxID=83641 RepID=UPI003CF5406D
MSSILVTGGSGFIGSALVTALVRDGHSVRVIDDNSRGAPRRLKEVANDVEFIAGDVRDPAAVARAVKGVDEVHHLAYVNGTEFFYSAPELVLDVGVKGMINVIDACRNAGIGSLILASSSEVYQTPPHTPTDERAPLLVPDVTNPRYSYGGGKIISELMAINYGRKFFDRVLIFRPHNIYGQDMGWEHVIPQFALRLKALAAEKDNGKLGFKLQGDGSQTRSFCHVDDLVRGVLVMRAKGAHLGIYHVGTTEEVTMADLAQRIARRAGREIELIAGSPAEGGTPRRCPDISKLRELGYSPQVTLDAGLPSTVDWYWEHQDLAPRS